MNNIDIRSNVLFNIDDIKTLSEAYRSDKMSYQICSGKFFWDFYFFKYDVLLLEEFNNPTDWIKSFGASRETKRLLNLIDTDIIEDDYGSVTVKNIFIELIDININDILIDDLNRNKDIINFIKTTNRLRKNEFNRKIYHEIQIIKRKNKYNIFYILMGYDIKIESYDRIDELAIKTHSEITIYKLLYKLIYSSSVNICEGEYEY